MNSYRYQNLAKYFLFLTARTCKKKRFEFFKTAERKSQKNVDPEKK